MPEAEELLFFPGSRSVIFGCTRFYAVPLASNNRRSQRRGDAGTPLRRKLQASPLWFQCAPDRESESKPLPVRMSHDLWPSDQRQWADTRPSVLVIPAFYCQVTPPLQGLDVWEWVRILERLQICGTFPRGRGLCLASDLSESERSAEEKTKNDGVMKLHVSPEKSPHQRACMDGQGRALTPRSHDRG